MKQINETLKTLSHITTQIDMLMSLSRATNQHKDLLDGFVKMEGWYATQRYSSLIKSVNLNYILIFANSYLDEFHRYLTPINYPEYSKNIIGFRKVISPALKRIKKWKHLKEYRNELLVHNYRVKDKSIFSASHQVMVYNAPSTNDEILLLGDLILLINKQLLAFFPAQVNMMLAAGGRITDRYEMVGDPVNYKEDVEMLTKMVEELKEKELKNSVA
jgi:hypothetical protein